MKLRKWTKAVAQVIYRSKGVLITSPYGNNSIIQQFTLNTQDFSQDIWIFAFQERRTTLVFATHICDITSSTIRKIMGQVLQRYLEIKRKNKTWRLILAFGIRGVFSWYEVAVILYSKTTESLLPSNESLASKRNTNSVPFLC